MVDNTTAWFREHPLYDTEGQPIVGARLELPGPGAGPGPAQPGQDRAQPHREGAPGRCPFAGQQAEWSARLEEKRIEVERALEYVELYGLYAECEAIYAVDHLLALARHARPRRTARLSTSIPGSSTGRRYIAEVHLPSVIEHARVKTTPGQDAGPTDRAGCAGPSSRPIGTLAAFDLENTLIASNVVESYSWLATRRLDRVRTRPLRAADAGRGPGLLALDRKDRGDFLRFFYRRYEDAPVAQLDDDAVELLSQLDPDQELPRRHPPRARAPRPRPPHAAHHRRPGLRRPPAGARCSTRSSRPR